MGLQPKVAVVQSKSTGVTVADVTGAYNASTNPGGYGAPNPIKASVTEVLIQQAIIGEALPTASRFTVDERADYLDGIGVATGNTLLKDRVYDIRALIGYAGASTLTAAGGSNQFTLTNASTVFANAVGFTLNTDPTILYRIDRTKPLTISSAYTIETLPAVTNGAITIYYEAQVYALVYDQGEDCLLKDIADADLGCDCSSEDTNALLERYAEYLSMKYKFTKTLDYEGADKLAKKLQGDCDGSSCLPCDSSSGTTTSDCVAPVIVTQPSNATVNVGQSVILSVTATGTAALKYQWRKNGVNISGATAVTLPLLNIQNADAGSYTVLVYNACGQIVSAAAVIGVTDSLIPITIIVQPQSQVVAPGTDVVFSVAATGSPTITYQWRKGGIEIVGETGSTLTLTAVDGADEDNYDVIVTNPVGSVTSDVATLTLGEVALWGWRDTVPTTVGHITALQGSGAFTAGGTIIADFRANNVPKYLVMAEPSTEPAKTKWWADATNYGNIGDADLDLFDDPVIIGSWRVYVTVYKTYNTQSPFEFRVS